ncbi:MAG: Hsp33 family molecular chaperone HslO [Aerococcaceae bacterium]|nr:Hsp33 family molecular chaperone HslO [Aerococcaceae bacterium]
MTNQLLKALAYGGQIRVLVLDSTGVAEEARRRHQTWHTATAVLGRTLAATLLLGANAKGDEKVRVEILGEGPVGRVVAEGDSLGNVRGFVSNPHVALPLNAYGKLDVAGAVGLPGSLTVRKLLGQKELFSGQVPLVSGELAEDFTYYMAVSEQTSSCIGLSVLVNADEEETVAASGGFMIQVMPGATDETLDDIERRIAELGRFSELLESQNSLEDLLDLLVGKGNSEILEKSPVQFYCASDRAYFEKGILSVGREEIEAMIVEDHGAEVVCHYCNDHFQFSEQDLTELLLDATKGEDHV